MKIIQPRVCTTPPINQTSGTESVLIYLLSLKFRRSCYENMTQTDAIIYIGHKKLLNIVCDLKKINKSKQIATLRRGSKMPFYFYYSFLPL